MSCALVLAVSCGGDVGARERRRAPVLIVALDGVPARMTGIGGETSWTPVLDRLARESLCYTTCLAPEPWSDAGLVAALRGACDASAPTLAADLERAGWRTVAVLAHDAVATPAVMAGFGDVRRLGVGDEAGALASDVVREALTIFDQHDPRPPFVLVHLADSRPPHHRYKGLVPACDAPYDGPCAAALPHSELLRLAPTFGPADFARLEALLASEVAATDAALGALLDGLARRSLTEDVVVLVVGTRGAWRGAVGRVGLLPGVEPEVLHVPCVLRLPARLQRGRSGLALTGAVDLQVTLADMAPTLRDVLGLAPAAVAAGLPVEAAAPRGAIGDSAACEARFVRDLAGRTVGRSVLPGAPAPRRLIRVGTGRGHSLAAVYAPGVGLVRDVETGAEHSVGFGPPEAQGPATLAAAAAAAGLAVELDAWLGPVPRETGSRGTVPRKR